MHYRILACVVAAILLISCATCTPVNPYEPNAYRSAHEGAKAYDAWLVQPYTAEGLGGYDYVYGHYYRYYLVFKIELYTYPYTTKICKATVFWWRGSHYYVSKGGCEYGFNNFNNYYNN